jgi:uracil-DNA glycosylase family 4
VDRNCTLCKLKCGAAVPGHGPTEPKLIVISDYPGKKETEEGKNMVGRAGQVLRSALRNIVGIHPENDVFYLNVIRCEPGENKIGKSEITACRRWTNIDLQNTKCDMILIAGSLAFEVMLPQIIEQEKLKDPEFNISRAHGSIFQHLGRNFMVTWNPAHVEQNKFKRIVGGSERRPIYEDWFTTGSVPDLFTRDMQKLRQALIQRYGELPPVPDESAAPTKAKVVLPQEFGTGWG